MSETKAPAIYAAISGVMRDLGEMGLGKEGYNQGQKFSFRGIDDVYAALNPVMVRHGVLILPRYGDGTREELTTKSGGVMHSVIIPGEFDLVCTVDGSCHTIRTIGEAQDSGDKASSKAMSIALKYAAFQAFLIPIKGQMQDQEEHTPEATRPRMSPKEASRLLGWANQVIERVGKVQNQDELDALKREDGFGRKWKQLNEVKQQEIMDAFRDRAMDFEPPIG